MTDEVEVERLRLRIAALERERIDELARAHAAVAAAQEQTYWLDRYNVDLDRLMHRPPAVAARRALKLARATQRKLTEARRALAR